VTSNVGNKAAWEAQGASATIDSPHLLDLLYSAIVYLITLSYVAVTA